MYIKSILEKYCFKTVQYLLFVYNVKLYYNIEIYSNRIELEFYTHNNEFVYDYKIYLLDGYIHEPDVLALKVYHKLTERGFI